MLSHTEVGQFDITIRIDEYVCPFDIPVRKGKQSWISKSDMHCMKEERKLYLKC